MPPILSLLKAGQIFFTDSSSTAAKIVKFLMASDSLKDYLMGKTRFVPFYHAGMLISPYQIIEQQSKVRIAPVENIWKHEDYIVWQYLPLTDNQKFDLVAAANRDLGKGFGVVETVGKTLSWITGLPIFADTIKTAGEDICVVRVARWYKEVTGETFGVPHVEEITTELMQNYMLDHKKAWAVIAIGKNVDPNNLLRRT